MVAISVHDTIAQQFRDQFVCIDGQYYFSVPNIDWMLPVDENIPWKKENLFGTIYGFMRAIVWALTIGMAIYIFLHQSWSSFLILIPFFIVGTSVHVLALVLPNLDLWRRLRAFNAQPDEIRSQLLVRKPETP
ncbi:hypothetical protein EAO27_04235 [Sphingopyxis sp. YF1]|uniref:hypothetical protein n=1 Tax=Sphingopyxis sp. YF1 TaxID=2482763 RepID=UPI001F613AD0|nr:hypothetical protein [Sphingopyxis sp. YF1]UNU42008.1 hypothetical protein EAO27_04235 [Sphingopyxis sp. YF1]